MDLTFPFFAAWLQLPDGTRLPVGREGVSIGRRSDAHLVLNDPRVSTDHCRVTLVAGRLEITPLGRNPTCVNSVALAVRSPLVAGDSIDLPGVSLVVVVEERKGTVVSGWRLSRGDGVALSIRPLPFRIGGGGGDDLVVPGLRESCVVFHAVDTSMAVEVLRDVQRNGETVAAGTIAHTLSGDRWAIGQTEFLVECDLAPADAEQTQLVKQFGAIEVQFRFLAEGGRLDVRLHSSRPRVSVLLSELRARLVATLLRPPRDYQPGEEVPDEVLLPSIWPGQTERGRGDLNQLIHRTRKDLLKAGLDPDALLERVGRVGATRFRLAADAHLQFGD